jgi:hypothetical protein
MNRYVMEKHVYPTDEGYQIHYHKDKASAYEWQHTVRLVVTKTGEVMIELFLVLL